MQFSAWVFLLFLLFFSSAALSNPRFSEAGINCGSKKQLTSGNSIPNFIYLMEKITNSVNEKRWGAYSVEVPPSDVFAVGECLGDLSPTDCSDCFSQIRVRAPRCLPSDSGRIYLDGCFLRYDNYDFFHESINSTHDAVKCGPRIDIAGDIFLEEEFEEKVEEVIMNVTENALKHHGFAVMEERGGAEGVYALAQCWKTMDDEGCRKCLENAGSELKKCVPAKEGRALYTGCYLRYSTERFYRLSSEVDDDQDSDKIEFFVAGILSAASLFILALFGARIGYKKVSKMHKNLGGFSNNKLNFKYEMLEEATNHFDLSRKLGQGGAGSVFKGILPDGRIVAVKRLFFNSRHWVDEFFNEVNLIGGIKHENLVRLLGCSLEGPESLLIYEYVPNRSLDQIIFVKDASNILSWKQRYNIICGIAEGLAYLHGGSGVKIIHRDIKASNILLDERLVPKIADFGLVRCLSPDNSHINTGIAGTLGYMAPEYLVQGQLSEKADVYAFGVLVLEIGCGRKNSVFTQGSSSVLHSVWKHYKANQITNCVDSILNGRFSTREASTVLQIGLLCTQASGSLRPSMFEVVRMLKDQEHVIPSPKQPPFLNASVLSEEETSRSSTMNVDASSNLLTSQAPLHTVE